MGVSGSDRSIELKPTWKAFRLFFALRHFGVDEITSPELTGDWEFKLKQMEHGELDRAVFMDHIVEATRELVKALTVRQGWITMLVSHHADDIAALATRKYRIAEGRLLLS